MQLAVSILRVTSEWVTDFDTDHALAPSVIGAKQDGELFCLSVSLYISPYVCLSVCLSMCVCTRRKLIDTICYIVRLFCVHTIRCFIDSASFGFYVATFTAQFNDHSLDGATTCCSACHPAIRGRRMFLVCRPQKCKAGNIIIIGVTTRIWE